MRVSLQPGAVAYFLIAKTDCQTGQAVLATRIAVQLARSYGQFVGPAQPTPPTGVSALDFCTDGAADPGNLLGVSPMEPAERAVFQV